MDSYLDWFWMNYYQTKSIMVKVPLIQSWIDFGLNFIQFWLKFWYDIFKLFKPNPSTLDSKRVGHVIWACTRDVWNTPIFGSNHTHMFRVILSIALHTYVSLNLFKIYFFNTIVTRNFLIPFASHFLLIEFEFNKIWISFSGFEITSLYLN